MYDDVPAGFCEAAANRLTPGNQFSTGNIASRWQGRLGVRVSF